MRLLSFKWTLFEKWTRAYTQDSEPNQSNPIPIQPRFNQAFQAEMNIEWIYFIVLFCDLDTALANWLLYHTLAQIETN